jgi:hypothetical protein
MQVCRLCGEEVCGDGVTYCRSCASIADMRDKDARRRRNAAKARRRQMASALRDCGLVRVRGALGGEYWE